MRAATAQVENARAALEQARRSAARARQLGKTGTIGTAEQVAALACVAAGMLTERAAGTSCLIAAVLGAIAPP